MAYALVEYQWNYIAPGESIALYLYPFAGREVVAFCITVGTGNRPGFTPAVDMREGTVQWQYPDGLGRTVWIENKSISHGGPPTPNVTLTSMIELLPA